MKLRSLTIENTDKGTKRGIENGEDSQTKRLEREEERARHLQRWHVWSGFDSAKFRFYSFVS